MQSTSVPPWRICYYPNPNRINLHHFYLPNDRSRIRSSSLKNQTHFTNNSTLYLNATNSCSKNQEKKQNKHSPPYPTPNNAFLEQLYSSSDEKNHPGQNTRNSENKGSGEESEFVLTNMWWADFKAALGQRINIEGIVCAFGVFTRDRQLAVPHVAIPDIRYIDWCELRRRGFQGVVFDKDNTLTVPYSLTLWPPLGTSLEQCKSAFGDDIAVFSNSAGLLEYDPDGRKARALESAIGITVIRHKVKKPGGTAEEIEKHFGCESSRLIMVGDRPFTDIVYGNRNSFLTILTEPLSLAEEPLIVKQVRKLEVAIANLWSRQGMKPPTHKLPPGALEFVRKPPPM